MSLTSTPVVPCSCAEGWKPEGWAYCADCYEGQIERFRKRIIVLERVISEDLNPNDCSDDLNSMIVEDILKLRDGLALPSTPRETPSASSPGDSVPSQRPPE